jgi:hypothetical protein
MVAKSPTFKLIHLHIPKCAGSTLNPLLTRAYPPGTAYKIRVIDGTRSSQEEFFSLSESERTSLRLVLGHMRFGLHSHLPGNWSYFSFVREPVSRITSFYTYAASTPHHRFYRWIMDEKVSFERFVEERSEGDIHNGQTLMLMDDGSFEVSAQLAIERMRDHYLFTGLTERFDESLFLLWRCLGFKSPPLYMRERVSGGSPKPLIDARLRGIIEEKNAEDMKLYAWCREMFEEAMAHRGRDFDRRLAQYRRLNAIFSPIRGVLRRVKRMGR